MTQDFQMELQELGLLPAEAQVYLALVRNGALSGSAIASVTGFPRSSVYLTLNSLLDKGLVEGGAGRGSRFSVVPPEQALPSLVVQERESFVQRETLANKLGQRISTLVEPVEAVPEELIQIIRNPRAVAERYDRLRLEAQRSVEVFCKAPIFIRADGDPLLEKVLRRGVRCRGLYERAILDAPAAAPYLAKWMGQGEEMRVYDGNLPHKLALFDRQSVFVALTMPGDQMRTVFISHPELAGSLGMLFDSLWERGKPLDLEEQQTTSTLSKAPGLSPRISHNGRRGHHAKK